MKPYGEGKKGIMVVGEAPGAQEDTAGRPFVGPAGQCLRDALRRARIDLDRDCKATNVVQCRPRDNIFPGPKIARLCNYRLHKQIEKYQPKLIMAFGEHAIQWVLGPPFKAKSMTMRGRIIPSLEHDCWVSCNMHPSYVLRRHAEDARRRAYPQYDSYFLTDIKRALLYIEKDLPQTDINTGNSMIDTVEEAVRMLERLGQGKKLVAFDYETTRLSPFAKDAKVLTIAVADSVDKGYCIPVEHPEGWTKDELAVVRQAVIGFLTSPCPKAVHNLNFEVPWSVGYFGCAVNNLVQDTMLDSHIIDSRQGTSSLEFEVFQNYGISFKDMVDTTNLINTPLPTVAKYNALDARFTAGLAKKFRVRIKKDGQANASTFLRRGALCMANMQIRGVPVDAEELATQQDELLKLIEALRKEITSDEYVRAYNKASMKTFKPSSPDDLRDLLSDYVDDYNTNERTRTGKVSTAAGFLTAYVAKGGEAAGLLKTLLEFRKLSKFESTYLTGIRRYINKADGRIHPQFNLFGAETFRSSSSKPNLQNLPARDSRGKQIRRIICAPPGYLIMEADFSAAEVRTLAMYSNDRNLLHYIREGVDFHRKWAAVIYEKPQVEVTKEERSFTKTNFVFPLFYGSWYKKIAQVFEMNADFMKGIENSFWKDFQGVKRWQKAYETEYRERDYVETKHGFKRYGPLTRNQIWNTPIQSTSFHLLLECAVKIEDALVERKLSTEMIGEVHDSILFFVPAEEAVEVYEIGTKILSEKFYPWMSVAMQAEWSVGNNWADMEKL